MHQLPVLCTFPLVIPRYSCVGGDFVEKVFRIPMSHVFFYRNLIKDAKLVYLIKPVLWIRYDYSCYSSFALLEFGTNYIYQCSVYFWYHFFIFPLKLIFFRDKKLHFFFHIFKKNYPWKKIRNFFATYATLLLEGNQIKKPINHQIHFRIYI